MCFFATSSKHQQAKLRETKKRNKYQNQRHAQLKHQAVLHQESSDAGEQEASMIYQHFGPAAPYVPNAQEPLTMANHPAPTFHEVYIYPKSMAQISFPVVDFNRKGYTGPSCYIALAPTCATPEDIEAGLAPSGSGLAAVARLPNYKTAPLGSFRDAADIRCHSIQLEVVEEALLDQNAYLPSMGRMDYGMHGHGCDRWKVNA